MKKIILPTTTLKQGVIEKVVMNDNLLVGSTVGLVKDVNEDRVGCVLNGNDVKICLADGHWGEKAAEIIVGYWTKEMLLFPVNKEAAVLEVIKIEKKLFKLFGKIDMNPNSEFTPEASFIVVQLKNNILKIISYGDCRLLIAKEGVIKTKLTTKETWLGAFSRLGLRDRISVKKGLVFEERTLMKNDVVFVFTDGIDQCVYEKDTLSDQFLANQTHKKSVKNIFEGILNAVFLLGAEDNASLVVLKI